MEKNRKKKKTKKKVYLIILVLIFLVFLASQITYITLQNQLASEDNEYALLLTKLLSLQDANLQLYDQILQAESLSTISEKAREMGFTDYTKTTIIYLQ